MFIISKIQFFESKSQQRAECNCRKHGCLSDQRYNFLKANHNWLLHPGVRYAVVYQIKDTIFWKQITTHITGNVEPGELFIRSKIQFFESKSQLNSINSSIWKVVYQIKDTIFWKQITTIMYFGGYKNRCLSDQRYNFLKANHNALPSKIPATPLFIRSKIQFFESKSQLLT